MAATTPTGSLSTRRQLRMPKAVPSGRSRSQANSSMKWAGQTNPSESGSSSWGP